jgi:glycoprotein 3-alpha-L-fucosyltransferase
MGAAPEDYAMAAPPNSYIHVDDFESPQHLAAYLRHLDVNDRLYNEYFRWKGTGSFIDTKFWCRLCAILNESKLTGASVWYGDLEKWWNGPGVCIRRTNGTWASWNDVRRRYGYLDNDTLHVQL